MSRIEQVIEEMEAYLDGCKYQTLSNSKIVVNREDLEDFVADLKSAIPDEVRKYQRMLANRDSILRDAQDKAEQMIKKANEMTVKLVSEHEIMQKAYSEANIVLSEANAKADGLVQNATAEANAIKSSALQYTDEALATIQGILSSSLNALQKDYSSSIQALKDNLDVTNQNRKALAPSLNAVQAQAGYQQKDRGGEYSSPNVIPNDGIRQFDDDGDLLKFLDED